MKTNGTRRVASADPASGHGPDAVVPTVPAAVLGGDGRTRLAVARVLMEQGPVTAAAVATDLELTEAAVRRHLDALIADAEAETRRQPSARPRGRGRPAKEYVLTDAGRVRFGHGYDDLATSALRFLAEQAGSDAVDAFARQRVRDLIGGEYDEIAAMTGPDRRADALARVLTARGYAAQARKAGRGVQLCQHHCPVAHVAAEFPELCEAETKAFSELLGTHVQRLATIARGDAACTTHVPLEDPELLARAREREGGASGRVPVKAGIPASSAVDPQPATRVRKVQAGGSASRAVDPSPRTRVREVQEGSAPGAVDPSSRTRVREVLEEEGLASGTVDPSPRTRVRKMQEEEGLASGTVDPSPRTQVRKMQEEEGPAEGGTISHHGPRKGGSPHDDHS